MPKLHSGSAFTTQPVVTLKDAFGSTVTNSTAAVTITVSGNGTTVGTTTVNAVAGVATFSGVGISGTVGSAYTLTFASAGLTSATQSITPTSPGLVVSHSGGVLQVTMNSSRTISDLHTAVSGGGSTLLITVVHDGVGLSLSGAPAGVSTDYSSVITVDLSSFTTFAGITVVGSSSADTVTIGSGGVDLSATTGGAANQSFTINTGSGADVVNFSNIIKTKGTGAVSITSESLDGAGLITAPTVTLAAATGIGATNPLNLAATTIAANSTVGHVHLNNASSADVTVTSLSTKETASHVPGGQHYIIKFAQTGGGGITFSTVSTLGTTIAGYGEIQLKNTGGNMTIGSGGVVSQAPGGANILLVTNTSGNIILNGSVDSSAGGGAVAIRSAGSISGAGLIYPSGGGRLDDLIAQTGINVKVGDAHTSNLTLSTTSGNITIQSTSSAGFNLPAFTASGDLSITTNGALTQSGAWVVGGTRSRMRVMRLRVQSVSPIPARMRPPL
ncbi:MAG: hypothetical protein NTX09_16030 [Verrucomicrobia bacterium]|nr:hypothetical protein [Verrucomicrobiota bacterium]